MSLKNRTGSDHKYYDPIHSAAEQGNLEKVRNLIERWGVNVDTKCAVLKKTPIFIASQHGHLELVKYLINKGANVNEKTQDGYSALWVAASCGHLNVVQYLVHNNADIQTVSTNGNNLLSAALLGGNEDIFMLFIGLGVRLDKNNPYQILENAVCGGNVNFVKYLETKHKFRMHYPHFYFGNNTFLHTAAENGFLDIVKYLFEKGASVNARKQHNITALWLASKNGHLDVVAFLLRRGASVHIACLLNLYAPLHAAVHYNHKEVVELLLKHCADVYMTTADGDTPLHIAAKEGHLEIAKLLIASNAPCDTANAKGLTPLRLAEVHERTEMVQFLKEMAGSQNEIDQAPTTSTNKLNFAPLTYAKDPILVINHLLNNPAVMSAATALSTLIDNSRANVVKQSVVETINANNLNGDTLLLEAARKKDEQIVSVESGADINDTQQRSDMPLHVACSKGHLDIVKSLVEQGGDVNSVSPSTGRFPLYEAVCNSNNEVAKYLVKHRAHVNRMVDGKTCLHVAVQNGNLELVKILVRYGANLDSRDGSGLTPLEVAEMESKINIVDFFKNMPGSKRSGDDVHHAGKIMKRASSAAVLPCNNVWNLYSHNVNPTADTDLRVHYVNDLINAVRNGNVDVVKDLLSKRAPVNTQLPNGDTLLLDAARAGQYEIAKLFVEKGADVNQMVENRSMPLHAACVNGHLAIVKLLVENGANVNLILKRNNRGPLHEAAYYNQLEIAQYLLKHNAKINRSDTKCRETPLHLAALRGHLDMVKFLVDNKACIRALNTSRLTPLGLAIRHKRLTVVQFLKGCFKSAKPMRSTQASSSTSVKQDSLKQNACSFVLTEQEELIARILNGDDDPAIYHALKDEICKGNLSLIEALVGRGLSVNQEKFRIEPFEPMLTVASRSGQLAIVEFLVEHGAHIEPRHSCVGPLYAASREGHLEVVQYLVEKGADVNFVYDEYNHSPVFGAVFKDRKDVLEYLISHNADVNQVEKLRGNAPLHTAAGRGKLGLVKILIKSGAKLDVFNKAEETPLRLAAKNKKHKVVDFLRNVYKEMQTSRTGDTTPQSVHLETKSSVTTVTEVKSLNKNVPTDGGVGVSNNVGSPDGSTSLWEAVTNDDIEAFKSLIAKGANVNEWRDGESLLHWTTRTGHYDLATLLVTNQADVNVVDHHGFTPLYLAAKQGRYDIVNCLLKARADVNLGSDAFTPLYAAVTTSHLQTVRALLDNKGSVTEQFANGDCVLHLAAQIGDPLVFNALVQAEKVNVNIVNKEGVTPLYLASRHGHLEIVKMLISRVPDLNRGADMNFAPLHGAAAGGWVEVARLLVNEGANVYETSLSGDTVLHEAARSGHLDVVVYLVQEGVSVNAVNNDGETAMGVAAQGGHMEIANFLTQIDKADPYS